MDFFEHQAAARRTSFRLVLLFALAVVGLTLGVYALFAVLEGVVRTESIAPPEVFDISRVGLSLAFVGVLVGGGAGVRIAQLAGGGRVVAESLGGRLASHTGGSAAEVRALNVVEEMAIASGAPVPPVYLLEHEPGINAFAAGFGPKDAVIGLTRGAIEELPRQELQGVVAHEFSHILNGDMRLNVRLIGLLHGILMLTLFGRTLLRLGFHSPSIGRGRSRDRGGGAAPALLAGLGLLVLGSIGHLFARMIQSAVSRQREYLADASAVQYTRSVDGISGALERLGRFEVGSTVEAPQAEEAAHMMFGSSASGFLARAFATHPPLEQRVGRLRGLTREQLARMGAATAAGPTSTQVGPQALLGLADAPASLRWSDPQLVSEAAGSLTDEEVDYARALLESIPPVLRAATIEPFEGRALVYALLLSADRVLRAQELARLEAHADGRTYTATLRLAELTAELEPRLRLPLIDLAARELRRMSARQYAAFRANLLTLIISDGRVTPFEHALRAVILRQLDPLFGRQDLRRSRGVKLAQRLPEATAVVSLMAHGAGDDPARVAAAWDAARRHLPPGLPEQPLDLATAEAGFEIALERLWSLDSGHERVLLEGLWLAAASDGSVRVMEAELFRAIAGSLACPMPPLLAGQPVQPGVLPGGVRAS